MGTLRNAYDNYNKNLSLGDKVIANSVTKNLNKEPTSLQDAYNNYINQTPESIGTKNGKLILSNFLKIINYES